MKKLIWIFIVILYSLSISTIAHASTMGFFSDNSDLVSVWHCHSVQESSSEKQNMDCCELAFSNEYSQTQIQPKQVGLWFSSPSITLSIYSKPRLKTINKFIISSNPWRNPYIKYNKFSDLFGIVLSLS